jgi:hypothetical protein
MTEMLLAKCCRCHITVVKWWGRVEESRAKIWD